MYLTHIANVEYTGLMEGWRALRVQWIYKRSLFGVGALPSLREMKVHYGKDFKLQFPLVVPLICLAVGKLSGKQANMQCKGLVKTTEWR